MSVVVAVNARGDLFMEPACLGKLGIDTARRALSGLALAGAIVSTDRLHGYVPALREIGAAVHRRFPSSGSHAPLNRVNSVHSSFKTWLARFRGVSTRRLRSYLDWFMWLAQARKLGGATSLCLEQLSTGSYSRTWSAYPKTPYPFHWELNEMLGLG